MRHLARMAAPHWLALYGTLLAAWGAVWLMASPTAGIPFGAGLGQALRDLCLTPAAEVGPGGLLAMWLIMSAAMMLPTAIPALATFDDIADAHGLGGGSRLMLGYALVWVGFSVLAALVALVSAGAGAVSSPGFAAALLGLAGLYQLSPLKDACLSRCRAPLTFFMAHWAEGPLRMGLRLGAVCLGCCWALMALGLIGGAMSLGFMALATLLMTLEKLSRGAALPRAIGLGCLVGAGYLTGGYL